MSRAAAREARVGHTGQTERRRSGERKKRLTFPNSWVSDRSRGSIPTQRSFSSSSGSAAAGGGGSAAGGGDGGVASRTVGFRTEGASADEGALRAGDCEEDSSRAARAVGGAAPGRRGDRRNR